MVARLKVDSFDETDLSGAQCFRHDYSAHASYTGYTYVSNSLFETQF